MLADYNSPVISRRQDPSHFILCDICSQRDTTAEQSHSAVVRQSMLIELAQASHTGHGRPCQMSNNTASTA